MGRNERKISFVEMASLLHSVLFVYEKAHGKLMGRGGRAILQELVKELSNVLERGKLIVIEKGKPPEENIKNFVDFLNNEEYVFDIRGFSFAKSGVHGILEPKRDTCSWAVIAVAIVYRLLGKNVAISDSEFSENGGGDVLRLAG